ncbi:DUF805 domain-containing protein [Flavobacterium foetidum]|uniref:DUF805 domain-containing protein n=1 Tax=Flavobacterium foetidum TaxID=2026681 RepID=UPI001074CB9B|nr:DUF805 domain-containing protein [Flavobacterium foetidum]KAF2507474.1 DUF805 domain-containing protein [Flavobacterium foetidum]
MVEYYKKVVFENYANFKGRARRSEYWYFILAQFVIMISIFIVAAIIGAVLGDVLSGVLIGNFAYMLYCLATILPALGVVVRRLHDVGKSGWFYFISLIPFIGGIWLLVLLVTDGDYGSNQYGHDPKNIADEIKEIGNAELH